MPPAPKGNQYAWGNKGGGQISSAERRIRNQIVKDYWKRANKQKDTLLNKYFKSKDAPRDVINRLIPYARQEVAVTTTHTNIERREIVALMLTPEGRDAAELITKALLSQQRQEPKQAALPPPPTNGTGHE